MNRITFGLILLIITGNLNSQFVSTGGPGGGIVKCLYVSGSNLFAGTQTGGVYISSDNGSSWDQIVNGLGAQNINSLTGINNTIFAGVSSGLYRSMDNGSNWSQVNYGPGNGVTALTVNGSDIYLGTSNSYVYKSINNGNNWVMVGNNFAIGAINSILVANNIIYVAGNIIAASSNNGINWHVEGTGGTAVFTLFATGNIIRAGTNNGGKKNSNPLGGWVQDIPWTNVVFGYAQVGNYLIAGMSTGMFWSSDNGVTWHDPNSFYMPGIYVWSMARNDQYVFAGSSSGVYRRPVSEINGISVISSEIPEKFSLLQNYPNPFNPLTKIRFAVPKNARVVLELYDQIGQLASALLKQDLEPGTYEYSLDASDFSSGVYYYRLTSNDFSRTMKMIIVK